MRIDLDEARGDLAQLRADAERLQGEVEQLRGEREQLQGDLGQLKGGTMQMQAVQWSEGADGADAADASDAVVSEAAAGDGISEDMRARAQEVYDGINLALSELRQLIMTAEGLFGQHGQRIPDAAVRKKIAEALSNSVDRTEEAKGLLRGLKELTHH
jgi:predicted  nucleic acid-binding Zn-ribbon protein